MSNGLAHESLFPLLPAEALGPFLLLAKIEVAREAATLLMIAGAAMAATRNFRAGLAAFSLLFGVWDLTFYLWLKVLIGWPASLWTWDLLFLLPVPWVGPVIAPSLVSVSLILGGAMALIREPQRVRELVWVLLGAGATLIFLSFIWNWREIAAGGLPHVFPWAIFWSGELAGVAGLFLALSKRYSRFRMQDPDPVPESRSC